MKVRFRLTTIFYFRFLILLFFFTTAAGCGGGGGGSSVSQDPNTVDMWDGGTVTGPTGLKVAVIEGAGQGEVIFDFESPVPNTDPVALGVSVSDVYEINLTGFSRGETSVPFFVTIPVDVSELPLPIDIYAFVVQTLNETTGEWEGVHAMPAFVEDKGAVVFQTNHFSAYRAVYMGFDPGVQLDVYQYQSAHFMITYYLPSTLGQTSEYTPPTDISWGAGGGNTSHAEVPNYIEDLAKALEDALTHHTGVYTSGGVQLFSVPGDPIEVSVTRVVSGPNDSKENGDSRVGGPMRVNSRLDDWTELRTTAAHELTHVLSGQYYWTIEAAMNLWFFEGMADLWAIRAAGLTRPESVTYMSRELSTYLSASLDSSDEGSCYAVADFLNYVEEKTGDSVTADVVYADATWDINGLNTELTDGTITLSDYYVDYALNVTVGDYDLNPAYIRERVILKENALLYKNEFKQPHLSTRCLHIVTDIAKDCMLVATSGRDYPIEIPLKSFSYISDDYEVDDIATYLELDTPDKKPVVVKHFGKRGTAGVTASSLLQVVCNPLVTDNVAGSLYFFDYYLLVPPEIIQPVEQGNVSWTVDSSTNISGFLVYADGMKLTETALSGDARSYSDGRIIAGGDVTVTVVDSFGNEWPEVQITPAANNWEMFVGFIWNNDDVLSKDTTIIPFSEWIPVTVSSSGSVTFNHTFTDTDNSKANETIHIWGSGTYSEPDLDISGHWTTTYSGSYPTLSHNDTGDFTVGGHFLMGTFFNEVAKASATADSQEVTQSSEGIPPTTYYGNDQAPVVSLDNFRPLN